MFELHFGITLIPFTFGERLLVNSPSVRDSASTHAIPRFGLLFSGFVLVPDSVLINK